MALSLLLLSAWAPEPAHATTFANLTIEQFTDASTWIVEGQVVRLWTEGVDGVAVTRAEVAISEVHKGPSVPQSLIVSTMGGVVDGVRTVVSGAAQFSEGESVFLFLDQRGDQLSPVGMFLGKLTVRRASGEQQQHAMRWHGDASTTFDHRFLPHPAPGDRLYVSDLREQVQRRLDVGWDGRAIPGISNERLHAINTPERRMPR